jgi:ankyrin repeat protein
MFFKVFNENLEENGYSYKEGHNIYPKASESGKDYNKFLFTDERGIIDQFWRNSKIARVTIPSDEVVVSFSQGNYYASEIVIEEIRDIYTVDTFNWLEEQGIDVYKDIDGLLQCAVLNGKLDIIQYLIEKLAYVNTGSEMAVSLRNAAPLSIAALRGDPEIIDYLISEGANVYGNKNHVLYYAVGSEKTNIVDQLLNAGADIHAGDDAALYIAYLTGDFNMSKHLLKKGARLKAVEKKLLKKAILRKNTELIKQLLEDGANIRVYEYALESAIYSKDISILKCVVEAGADIHAGNDYIFYTAIRTKNLDIIKYLLKAGINIRKQDDFLACAVETGDIEIVKFLYKKGASKKDTKDKALYAALGLKEGILEKEYRYEEYLYCPEKYNRKFDFEMLNFLVDAGADINIKNNYLLFIAVRYKNMELAKTLLDKGTWIESRDGYIVRQNGVKDYLDIVKFMVEAGFDVNILLKYALEKKHVETVKYLLDCGANIYEEVKAYDFGEETDGKHMDGSSKGNVSLRCPLMTIIKKGDMELIKYLVEMGVDVHANDYLAFRLAVKNNQVELAKYLLSIGADVHVRNECALYYAIENGYNEIVNVLLDAGADPNDIDPYILYPAIKDEKYDLIDSLVGNGVNLHDDNEGLLRLAAENDEIKVLSYLLENKADIHACNDEVLKTAVENGSIETVNFLLSFGADIHVDNDWLLRYAVRKEKYKLTECLLKGGANVHVDHDYPLFQAVQYRNYEITNLLIAYGADVQARNKSILSKANNHDITQFLIMKGADNMGVLD